MTRNDFQILEMLGRVLAFCQAHDDKFPKESFAGLALAAIEFAIARAYMLAAIQTRASAKVVADAKEAAREGLIQQLESIQRTARGVSIDHPGTEKGFWIPGFPKHDNALLEAAGRFLYLMEPLKEAFVAHHLPEDFIDKFNATVEAFKQAIRNQNKAKSDRKGSFAQFSEVVGEGRKQLNRVESVVTNTFHDDAITLAAWDAARALTKPRRKKKAAEPAAAKPDEVAATSAEVAVPVVTAAAEVAPAALEPAKAGEEAARTTG